MKRMVPYVFTGLLLMCVLPFSAPAQEIQGQQIHAQTIQQLQQLPADVKASKDITQLPPDIQQQIQQLPPDVQEQIRQEHGLQEQTPAPSSPDTSEKSTSIEQGDSRNKLKQDTSDPLETQQENQGKDGLEEEKKGDEFTEDPITKPLKDSEAKAEVQDSSDTDASKESEEDTTNKLLDDDEFFESDGSESESQEGDSLVKAGGQGAEMPASIIEEQYRTRYSSLLSGNLSQFGYDVFRTARVQETSLAVPDAEYVLGTGDQLAIRIWGSGRDAQFSTVVDREGNINVPQIGIVPVAGVRYGDIENVLKKESDKYVQGIHLSVALSQLRSMEIFVFGAVSNPGLQVVPAFSTLFDALIQAGGVKKSGSLRKIKLYRSKQQAILFDMYELLLGGKTENNKLLQNKDVIFVPDIGKTAAIAGGVLNQGIFELDEEKTIEDLVNISGGLLPQASGSRIYLRRFENNQIFVIHDINAESVDEWAEYAIKNGDLVEVTFASSLLPNVVRLQGHVWAEDVFKFEQGMQLSDILSSPDQLMPDAVTDFAMIYRYDRKNARVVPIQFPLSKVFSGEYDKALQPFDRIQILSRTGKGITEKIAVTGAVWKPGIHEFKDGLRLVDALSLAGGLRPEAREDRIEIARRVKTESKFETEYVQLSLPADNDFILQAHDRIKVPSLKEYYVRLEGHIWYPDRIRYHSGMKLSDVLISKDLPKPEDLLKPDTVMEFALLYRYDPETTRTVPMKFPLSEVFEGTYDAQLHPFDRIQILSRSGLGITEKFAVTGAVWKPGEHEFKEGLKLGDALALAGGLKPEARSDRIEIARRVKTQTKFETKYIRVSLPADSGFVLKADDRIRVPRFVDYHVSLEGHVWYPDKFRYHSGMKLSDVLISKDLPKPEDLLKPDTVMEFALLYRYDPETTRTVPMKFPLSEVFEGTYDAQLHPFDRIQILSRSGLGITETFAVTGAVWKPGEHEFKEGLKLGDALALAGGLKPEARSDRIEVARRIKADTRFETQYITVSLPADSGFVLKNHDRIIVPRLEDYHVSLEGHVWYPEKRRFHSNMKLSDVLISNKLPKPEDLLKPNAMMDFGLIERYDPETTRTTSYRFPLSEVFSGKYDAPLQPFDVIKVLSRKALGIEETFRINGAVWNPGEFEFQPGLSLKDALALAGGLRFGARAEKIEVARQFIRENQVVTEYLVLDSDRDQDFKIQSSDAILVPLIKDASRIAQVQITGEVAYPGTYTIREGERISHLIERAGGFSEYAYYYGAKYTSEGARIIQQKSIDQMVEKLRISLFQSTASQSQTAVSQEDVEAAQAMESTTRNLLRQLENIRAEGRIAIKLADLTSFRDSLFDFRIKDGDAIHIPPKPVFVSVVGSVYSPGSFLYEPNKTFDDYLEKSGGISKTGDKKYMYLLKANGEILSMSQHNRFFSKLGSTVLMPGDTIVVPENLERVPYLRLVKDISDILFKIATTAGVAVAISL